MIHLVWHDSASVTRRGVSADAHDGWPNHLCLPSYRLKRKKSHSSMTDHSLHPECLSATEAAQAIREGRLKIEDLARACLSRADEDPKVKAWSFIDPDLIIKEAQRLDAVPMNERKSALFGLPVAIKDIFATKDMPTEYGSKRYEGHCTGDDARIVQLLRAKGCLIFGKTHTTEFACWYGGPSQPPTRNPRDLHRTPGASSSGSAAAVADFQCTLAIG